LLPSRLGEWKYNGANHAEKGFRNDRAEFGVEKSRYSNKKRR